MIFMFNVMSVQITSSLFIERLPLRKTSDCKGLSSGAVVLSDVAETFCSQNVKFRHWWLLKSTISVIWPLSTDVSRAKSDSGALSLIVIKWWLGYPPPHILLDEGKVKNQRAAAWRLWSVVGGDNIDIISMSTLMAVLFGVKVYSASGWNNTGTTLNPWKLLKVSLGHWLPWKSIALTWTWMLFTTSPDSFFSVCKPDQILVLASRQKWSVNN